MHRTEYALLIDIICGIAFGMVLVPLLLYLFRQWTTRRDKLLGCLDAPTLILYYRQFYPALKTNLNSVEDDFKKYFGSHYGRRHYVLPIVILTFLTAVIAGSGARTLQSWQKIAPDQFALPWIVVAAFAGGFTWVINDLIGRLRRRDFTVSDVYNSIFRILISAPFGWAFAQVVKSDVGVPLAFLLGAFPTGTLFTIGRRLAASKLGVSEDPKSASLELENLQSITKTNAERFYDEGISTIVQLAYADPIDLTIRTNFDFTYVIDCVSQALLWIYVGDKAKILEVYSLRGAQEVSSLIGSLRNPAEHDQAAATLDAAAGALGIAPVPLQTTLEQVADDPYTAFICSIWH